jgi:hypothetical protein
LLDHFQNAAQLLLCDVALKSDVAVIDVCDMACIDVEHVGEHLLLIFSKLDSRGADVRWEVFRGRQLQVTTRDEADASIDSEVLSLELSWLDLLLDESRRCRLIQVTVLLTVSLKRFGLDMLRIFRKMIYVVTVEKLRIQSIWGSKDAEELTNSHLLAFEDQGAQGAGVGGPHAAEELHRLEAERTYLLLTLLRVC